MITLRFPMTRSVYSKARDPRIVHPTLRKVREGWGPLSLRIQAKGGLPD